MNKLEGMLSGNGSRKCRERKGKRKRKRKRTRNTGMMMMMRMMKRCIIHPRTTMTTAKLILSSGPPEESSGKPTRRATHK